MPKRKVGFDDPAEMGFARLFKKPYPLNSRKDCIVSREDFPDYLNELRMLMREAVDKSERARDTYYALRDAYKAERGLTGFDLDDALKRDVKAQGAISDNIMYDRWAAKYAATLQAEIAYANFMGWGQPA